MAPTCLHCGSTSHQRRSHKDCPENTKNQNVENGIPQEECNKGQTQGRANAETLADSLVDTASGAISRDAFVAWYMSNYSSFTKDSVGVKRKKGQPLDENSSSGNKKRKKKAASSDIDELTKKRRTALLKAVKSSLRKGITSKKFYEYGSGNECPSEVLMTMGEFNALLGNVGKRVGNTASKTVFKRDLSADDVAALFGDLLKGMQTKTFSAPRFMCKQRKTGKQDIDVGSAFVSFSSNTNKCKMKFVVSNVGCGDDFW